MSLADDLADATDKANAYRKAIDLMGGGVLGVNDAQADFNKAVADGTAALAESGAVVDLNTGKTHIGDVKTGADADKYLHAHCIQLHLYASAPLLAEGIPVGDVDFETERFTEQTGVDQEVGYVFHLPLDGEPSVIPVDLTAGAWCLEHVIKPTWQWRARTDLRAKVEVKAPARITPLAPATATVAPAEGAPADDVDVDALRDRYKALDQASRAWIEQLRTEAQGAGVDFHLASRTARRYGIMSGLVELAAGGGRDTGDVVKALARIVIGDDAPSFANVAPGAAVGLIDADLAPLWVEMCRLAAGGELDDELGVKG